MSASHDPAAATGAALLFEHYQHLLRRRIRQLVHTSEANIEDACMYAWAQFLSHELDDIDAARSWLTTVAMREAVRLDRRGRRDLPLTNAGDNDEAEPVDPRDELRLRQLLVEAGAVINAARLTERQTQLVGMQMLGYTYEEISCRTGDSHRARQLIRARRKLARAKGGEDRPPTPSKRA